MTYWLEVFNFFLECCLYIHFLFSITLLPFLCCLFSQIYIYSPHLFTAMQLLSFHFILVVNEGLDFESVALLAQVSDL